MFDDAFLQLFALVPPSSNHEDLEDLVHFILESHQFSGASVVLDEVDLDQVGKFEPPLSLC